jgi:predicted PurR-regulated permease PerM
MLVKRYLLVQVATCALAGVGIGLSFWWLGMERAAVWGIAAAVLNMIPYLGSLIVAGGGALFGFLQFGTVEQALMVVLASTVVHSLVGSMLRPWLAGRAGKMSPFIIFASMLVWGWLWGVWGALLGVPIMMTIKAVCDRVDGLQPVGRLMGE